MASTGGRHRFFENEGFDFEFSAVLGASYYRCAEVGECLATADRIADGDFDSWFAEWMRTADRTRAIARTAEAHGHWESARDAYLRASRYYAAAFCYVLGTRDPSRSLPTWRTHRACFDQAIGLWTPPVEKVAIPYEDGALEGYWFSPESRHLHRPLVIFNNGGDGTVTDMLASGVVAAIERDYCALVFDGPGQGHALYEQHLPFRHDWERVITPVVDYALARPDVDPGRIALVGVSQAGYWVPRSVAFERRVAAAVADPGVTRMWTSWFDNFPDDLVTLFDNGDKLRFDRYMREGMDTAPKELRFDLRKRTEPYLCQSMFDVLTEVKRYDLTDVTDHIDCPMLVTEPDGEQFWPGQSQALFDALHGPKALLRFTRAEGAGSHCEPLAPGLRNQRVFDWLDAELSIAA